MAALSTALMVGGSIALQAGATAYQAISSNNARKEARAVARAQEAQQLNLIAEDRNRQQQDQARRQHVIIRDLERARIRDQAGRGGSRGGTIKTSARGIPQLGEGDIGAKALLGM